MVGRPRIDPALAVSRVGEAGVSYRPVARRAARRARCPASFRRSSVVERAAVNRLVVSSNLTAGATSPRPSTYDDRMHPIEGTAWRLVRGVTSNAIVLVRDRRLIGMGSGQTSRVDAARGAVAQARAYAGEATLIGASCSSDAFYPFADAVEVCLAAGVTAFAQPGGSMRDAEVVAAVDAVGGAMLMTGTRHFRH